MKIPYKIIPGSQPVGMAKSLASAAVILSLTACGADTLDSLEASLANGEDVNISICLLYTSPSPRDGLLSRMPSSA